MVPVTAGTAAVDVTLTGLGRCLRVANAPEVLEALTLALPGWPLTTHPPDGAAPALYVYRDADGLWQSDPGTDEEFLLPSSASAACSLAADLLSRRLEHDAELVGLHCGSVEINGRLALFPQGSRAGKSTLSTAFAAAGYRIFGDDVLGLTPDGEGVAMGVAPRLRLPLPASLPAELTRYIGRHAGPSDDRYRYVLPFKGGLAQSGETCPVGALVLLERSDTPVRLEAVPLSPGDGLLQLLCQNFARETAPQALMARFLPLMERVPCLLLSYSDPLAGARHLASVLEGEGDAGAIEPEPMFAPPENNARLLPVERTTLWQHGTGVDTYPLGDELFLIQLSAGVIHRLNHTGRLVWQLLGEEPLAVDELGALLAEHFCRPEAEVGDDVAALMAALHGAGLVEPAEAG